MNKNLDDNLKRLNDIYYKKSVAEMLEEYYRFISFKDLGITLSLDSEDKDEEKPT